MAIIVAFTVAALAFAAPVAPAPSRAAPTTAPASPGAPAAAKNLSSGPAATTTPGVAAQVQVDWRDRVAIGVAAMQASDPARLARLEALQPDRKVEDAVFFSPGELQDPRVAPVLLRRLLQSRDPVKVRCALVEALPLTGGDWQEGAAALVALDASPKVRKQLVEVMRYAGAPYNVDGLRRGFKDEDSEVNIAAARTAGFARNGEELFPELYSSTFDADWDLRAAAVQALGMLRLPKSRDVLIKALSDDEREVRLQAFLALEQIDPEGIIWLPELESLAKDRKSHRIARKAELMLRKRRAAEKAAKKAGRPITNAARPTSPEPSPPAKPVSGGSAASGAIKLDPSATLP
ncbi:HEAT repeat-containing protein [Nannocystis exedens]|uniref:HEAT repeat-containing protein n=1 Tax=Nannocystis exedens TaxID=54 RepID=A0A1I2C1I1_9BACT|nr:HEAT repeat domain-containing protein [Nannocystis exedens]PCC71138.1 HEAT repeat protein [Nannocystis exedens]SFE61998.1 HEAT repeat-containing protein [Nannocystis exedens]